MEMHDEVLQITQELTTRIADAHEAAEEAETEAT